MELPIDARNRQMPEPMIVASVAGLNAALTITSDAVVIAECRPSGWQPQVRCYPLHTVSAVRFLEDFDGCLLALEFLSGERRAVLFPRYMTSTAKRLLAELDSEVKKAAESPRSVTASQH
jgi:hypothetical protein